MPEGAKEAETAQTFDEDEYKSNLIDNEDYSEETAAVKAKKKKEQLEAQAEKGPVSKMIEIDLDVLEKAKSRKKILVRRGGKTFYREQEVGRKKDEDSHERLKNTASKLISQEIKLKDAGKTDEAKKLRANKINPILDKLNVRRREEARVADQSVESMREHASKLTSQEIRLKEAGKTKEAKKLREEKITPLLDKIGAHDYS